MQKPLLLTALLLLSVGLVSAQDQPSSGNASSGKNETTMRGCLQGAPSAFTLAADDGTTYQLTGDNGQLGHLVGKKVMVKGNPTSADLPTGKTQPSASNPAPGTLPTFTVRSAKKISDQCNK